MIIMPDYTRYTEFTLEERLMMDELARVRINTCTSFLVSMKHYEQAVAANAKDEVLHGYKHRCHTLLETLHEIDCAILEIYIIKGRVN